MSTLDFLLGFYTVLIAKQNRKKKYFSISQYVCTKNITHKIIPNQYNVQYIIYFREYFPFENWFGNITKEKFSFPINTDPDVTFVLYNFAGA